MNYQLLMILCLIIATSFKSTDSTEMNVYENKYDSIQITALSKFIYIDALNNSDTMSWEQLDSFYVSKTYCKPGTTLHTFQILEHPDNRNKQLALVIRGKVDQQDVYLRHRIALLKEELYILGQEVCVCMTVKCEVFTEDFNYFSECNCAPCGVIMRKIKP